MSQDVTLMVPMPAEGPGCQHPHQTTKTLWINLKEQVSLCHMSFEDQWTSLIWMEYVCTVHRTLISLFRWISISLQFDPDLSYQCPQRRFITWNQHWSIEPSPHWASVD